MLSGPEKIYFRTILQQIPRVLSLMDRERYSLTSGCMDRTFWSWKFVDYPGARFQEGLCVLSFLYTTDLKENEYFKNPRLLQWIEGGFEFWCKIQRSSGDFDEAYPFERSLAATAFSSFYLAEAFRFVGNDLSEKTAEYFRGSLITAGDWLINNDEKHGFLSNHLAAAAAALYHMYEISGEERFKDRAGYYIQRIINHQSSEGWYDEYGGADPGYQTHGSFYLVRYLDMSGDKRLFSSLERSFEFLAHFIHPDLSIGGEYTSRNTQTFYPAAFEMMSDRSRVASWISEAMLPVTQTHAAAGLGSVDIYNLFPMLNNYVFAYIGATKNVARRLAIKPPPVGSGVHHFPRAGLLKIRKIDYDLYVGLDKGGVIKIFDRNSSKLIMSDCGYIGKLTTGKIFSSQWTVKNRKITISQDLVTIEGSFYQIPRQVMDPYRFIAFRFFSLTFGRSRKATYWLKTLLVKFLIYRKRELPMHFERRIEFEDAKVRIVDFLQSERDVGVDEMIQADLFTTIHMGSSRYFLPNEMLTNDMNGIGEAIDTQALSAGIMRIREVEF